MWAGARFAVNGWTARKLVAASGTITEGEPMNQAAHRARLRATVAGMRQAPTATARAIAERAGITIATWSTWTKSQRATI